MAAQQGQGQGERERIPPDRQHSQSPPIASTSSARPYYRYPQPQILRAASASNAYGPPPPVLPRFPASFGPPSSYHTESTSFHPPPLTPALYHRPPTSTPFPPPAGSPAPTFIPGTVAAFLDSLELSEYALTLIREGFDRMESVYDIQEEDFTAMGVKRGHRRIIQRELATLRGMPINAPLIVPSRNAWTAGNEGRSTGRESGNEDEEGSNGSHSRESVHQTNRNVFHLSGSHDQPSSSTPRGPESGSATPSSSTEQASSKRRYRRHPKTDPNAPEKPPSAYVSFSNATREAEDVKGKSFTEIARIVGERWQGLEKEEKEQLEAHATEEKEKYASLLAAYKTTPEYAQYQEYLADFKIKHQTPATSSTTSGNVTVSAPIEDSTSQGFSVGRPAPTLRTSTRSFSHSPYTYTPTPPAAPPSRSSGEESAAMSDVDRSGPPYNNELTGDGGRTTGREAAGLGEKRRREAELEEEEEHEWEEREWESERRHSESGRLFLSESVRTRTTTVAAAANMDEFSGRLPTMTATSDVRSSLEDRIDEQ